MFGKTKADQKADIYSFGVLLCELLTSQKPWNNTPLQQIMFKVGIEKTKPFFDTTSILSSLLPSQLQSVKEMLTLASECMNYDPTQRSTFVQIVPRLESALTAITSAALSAPLSAVVQRKHWPWSMSESLYSVLSWQTAASSQTAISSPNFRTAFLDRKIPEQNREYECIEKVCV